MSAESPLDDDVVALVRERKNLASLTTLGPNGAPMTQPVWIDTDGQWLLVNTEVHRQKFRNIERDPRVNVLVVDHTDPSHYAEVRGQVVDTVRGPEARAHIDAMAKKYIGVDDYPGEIKSERVILRIEAERVSRFML